VCNVKWEKDSRKHMDRGKKSIYTAVSAITLTVLNGFLGLIVTRLVIANYGSDFNGLSATANQFINMILIVEGGFTLATNVALFKPLSERNHNEINSIMAATRKIFIKIGFIFLSIGIVASVGYSMVINSELPIEIAILTFLMTVASTALNLLYATKYSILLQTEQREYLLNFIKLGTVLLSQFMIIAIIFLHGHMLLVRFATMVGVMINSLLIGYACKRYYKYLDFNTEPNYAPIKGTKDVFAQKITSVIYSTIPIIFISATVGTLFASVYAVYNSIFALLKNAIYSLVNAPRMGFGQLIAEKDKYYVFKVFIQYEYIIINSLLCFLATAYVLIIPFINLYTAGISDVEYRNWYVALLLIGITFFEVIHIPSGIIINMSGSFKISKNFQIVACVVLVLAMLIGSQIFGFYGILWAVLITAILLAVLEITYIHKIYFANSVFTFLRLLVPSLIFSVLLTYIEFMLLPTIYGYIQFMVSGFVLVVINGSLIAVFNLYVNKSVAIEVFIRLRPFINRVVRRIGMSCSR